MKITFLGLGVMGYPMAGHISEAGYQVTIFNRTIEKAKKWEKEYQGHVGETIADAVSDADLVLMCLGNDQDVDEVVLGTSGVLTHMKSGGVLVDHTTVSANLAEKLARCCQEKSIGFLDAPVSGGESGAQNGILTVMVGGEQEILDRASPVLSTYGKNIVLTGPSGSGQRTKMVNQICIAGILQGLSEGLNLAEKSGLDIDKVLMAIGGGAAQSWQLNNRGRTMKEGRYDFGFATYWMIKDLNICIEEAGRVGCDLELTRKVLESYRALSEAGHGRSDTSCLIESLRSGE